MTELERQHAHYSAIKARLWAGKPKERAETSTVIRTIPVKPWKPLRPLWRQEKINFDAHVMEYRLWQADQVSPKRAYMRRRAVEMGSSINAILTGGRAYKIIAMKHLLMWEVKWLWPRTTFPEMARLFKLSDHTTALSAIKKMEARMRCDL